MGINQMLPDRLDINFYEYNKPENKLLFKLNGEIYEKMMGYANMSKTTMIGIGGILIILIGMYAGYYRGIFVRVRDSGQFGWLGC